jgi:hypothetical protein
LPTNESTQGSGRFGFPQNADPCDDGLFGIRLLKHGSRKFLKVALFGDKLMSVQVNLLCEGKGSKLVVCCVNY